MSDIEKCPSCDGDQDFECATCGNKGTKKDWIDNIIDAIVPGIVYKEGYHLPGFPPLQGNEALRQIIEAHYPKTVSGETSDGYHTFNELYNHRTVLFYVLSKFIPSKKSRLHYDGTSFDNYFVVQMYLNGIQISYHIENRYRDYFDSDIVEKADMRDGHSPDDVCVILFQYGRSKKGNKYTDAEIAALEEKARKYDELCK